MTVNPTQSQQSSYHYGIDIGGTKIEIGIYDSELHQVDSWRVPTPTENYSAFIEAILSIVRKADSKFGELSTIGIGMPGILNKQGLVKSANVKCANEKPIQLDLEKAIGRIVAIANDCRLFALSESNGGAGDRQPNVYGAIIGTGAGGGLCVNGRLFKSTNNIAGEYGHIAASGALIDRYKLPVRDCGCGLTGCVESYIAGPGLGWLYQHFGAQTQDTTQFVEDLRAGNPVAQQTFDCYIDLLGSSFASLVLSYDPDVIVVGGGLSKINEITHALPNAINQHLFSGVTCPEIAKAKFGDSSGVRGAAILGVQNAS